MLIGEPEDNKDNKDNTPQHGLAVVTRTCMGGRGPRTSPIIVPGIEPVKKLHISSFLPEISIYDRHAIRMIAGIVGTAEMSEMRTLDSP